MWFTRVTAEQGQLVHKSAAIANEVAQISPEDWLTLIVLGGGGKIGHVSLQVQLSKKIYLDTTFNTFENLIYHFIIISLWVYMRELCIYSCRKKKLQIGHSDNIGANSTEYKPIETFRI